MIRRAPLATWGAAALTLALAAGAASAQEPPRIIDGDTIEIAGAKVRLHGIDAPEIRQLCETAEGAFYSCGEASRAMLGEIIAEFGPPDCVETDRDRWGRIIGICTSGGVDIAAALVRLGWAVAYQKYSLDYVPDENAARAANAGMWAGRFENPAAYRRRIRE